MSKNANFCHLIPLNPKIKTFYSKFRSCHFFTLSTPNLMQNFRKIVEQSMRYSKTDRRTDQLTVECYYCWPQEVKLGSKNSTLWWELKPIFQDSIISPFKSFWSLLSPKMDNNNESLFYLIGEIKWKQFLSLLNFTHDIEMYPLQIKISSDSSMLSAIW